MHIQETEWVIVDWIYPSEDRKIGGLLWMR